MAERTQARAAVLMVQAALAVTIALLAPASIARAASHATRVTSLPVGRAGRVASASGASSTTPQTAADGSIAGEVAAAANSAAIEGIEVCAYPDLDEEDLFGTCATTNAAGEYAVSGLAGGEYIVEFSAPDRSTLNYLTQYYDGKSTYEEAAPVNVTDGAATSGIDAAMAVGGEIAGKATAASSEAAIEGIEVCAYSAEGDEQRCALTGAGGEYAVRGLASGAYTVSFSVPSHSGLNYLGQYYDDKRFFDEASKVMVTTGTTTAGIDAAMSAGGQITGEVTSKESKDPIEGIEVCAYSESVESAFAERCATSSSGGSYTISSLPTAEYVVEFAEPYDGTANYLEQYYDGKASSSEATKVAVSAESTTSGIDAAMLAGGEITGKVTSAASKGAIAGITVCATDGSGGNCATSGTGGEYTISGLRTGEYTVSFSPEYESSLNYVDQYYDGKSSVAEATKVAVTAGSTTPGIDAAMIVGGEIAGRVTSAATKDGLGGIAVCATASSQEYESETCTDTNSNGEYTLARLASGQYAVEFSPDYDHNSDYLVQYYDGKASFAEATKIAVSAGGTTSGIDAALLAGGEIAGKVSSATSKAALAGVEVCATAASNEYEGLTCADTNSDGEYTVEGLATGAYKVEFVPVESGDYQTQYYDDQASFANADQVSVTAGSTTSEIDAALLTAGEISGTVENANGEPITSEDVCVQAYLVSGESEDWTYAQSAVTNASGQYTIVGLQAGSYKIAFADCNQFESYSAQYASSTRDDVPQYYSGTTDWSSASLVVLSASGVKTGIDAELAGATTISGHVYSSVNASSPKASECVYAQQPSEGSLSWVSGPLADYYEVVSDSEGSYSLAHLAPGDGYVVGFADCGDQKEYLTQFDGGVSTPEAATVLTPTTGSPVTGVNAHLTLGAKITGLVTAHGSPIATDEICISASRIYEAGKPDAYPYDDYGDATSGDGGSYSIGGLSPGNYAVHFEDCYYSTRNDVSQYYDGAGSYDAAAPVEATLGSEHGGIDAELAPATSISGFAYGSPTDARPLDEVCVYAYSATETEFGFPLEVSYAYTADNGFYTLKHLPPGAGYKVEFDDCGDSGYSIQYYDEASTMSAATVLSPTLTEPLSGINAHLVNDVPVTEITGGPANDAASSATSASFSFTLTISGATYECKLDSAPYKTCTSPYTTGTLSNSEHSFTVRATVDGITDPDPPSVTWLVDPSSPNSTSEGSASSGGTVSSNPGEGPSSSDPVVVEATLPAPGTVTMTKEPVTTPSENGYTVFGAQLDIAATEPGSSTPLVGTVEHPIMLTFQIAGTDIPAGTEPSSITVLRNGEPAANCTGAQGAASPDPCVESRTPTSGGGVELTVLTTHCSLWNFVTEPLTKQHEEEAAKKKAEEEAAEKKVEEEAAKKKAEGAPPENKTEAQAPAEKAEEGSAKVGVPVAKAVAIVKIEKVKVAMGGLVVTIKASTSGTVTITGLGLKKTVERLAAGTHRLPVPFTKAGRAARRGRKKIKLAVSLKTSSGTAASSEKVKL